jgi:adenosylhomocysteine nucleosidase
MKNKYKTVFFVAMDYERINMFPSEHLKRMDDVSCPFPCFNGKNDTFLIETGISKTNAAAAAQWVFDHITAEQYINVGLVGSLHPDYHYGDAVVARECRFHDIDIRPLFQSHRLGQVPAAKLYTYPLRDPSIGGKIPCVRVITGDLFVTDHRVLDEIKQEYDPHCVEMEIAAIAHVAYLHNTLANLSSIKVISDKADENASEDLYTEERLFHAIKPVIAKYF